MLSSVVGLAGVLAILKDLLRCLSVFVRRAGRQVQALLDAMEARLQAQFGNLPTAGPHGDIAANKWNAEGLQIDVAKMAQEIAHLDAIF